jgi:hypothetical protein
VRIFETTAHWLFAIFMTVISYFATLILLAFVLVKLEGIPIGSQIPPGFHPRLSPIVFGAIAYGVMFLPMTIASYVGAATAPKSQLRVACIVFPFFVFLAVSIVPYLSGRSNSNSIIYLMEMGASCAVGGGLLYLRWKHHKSRKTAARPVISS